MENPPTLRVQLNGILLSTLLFECTNARVDYEGLLLGAIVPKVRSVVDDSSDTRVKTVYTTIVVQGVYKLEPNLPKFYGRSGEVNEAVLEQYQIPSNVGDQSLSLSPPATILEYILPQLSDINHQIVGRDD
ncbi:hypothetical protein BGZ80_000241 [Entomortierella chlamydospora]|uniref:Uncharacterized protein n=1 Tax=Entomortierella chlamydospora TaxID=101097 RepID=A0A9P6MSP5_9FUNG|nr:hypothetical protein BGZ80_000241 [Entomortierella chlamydospora]